MTRIDYKKSLSFHRANIVRSQGAEAKTTKDQVFNSLHCLALVVIVNYLEECLQQTAEKFKVAMFASWAQYGTSDPRKSSRAPLGGSRRES